MAFTLKQNDTSPAMTATLQDAAGAPVNLTGASVRFHTRRNGKAAATVDAAAVIVNAAAGSVRYNWSPPDTAISGTYQAEFEVTYADGSIETYPNTGYIDVVIIDDIA